MAARPFPGGRYTLRNNELTEHRLDTPSRRVILHNVGEVREALETTFGLTLPATAELDPAVARACGFPA